MDRYSNEAARAQGPDIDECPAWRVGDRVSFPTLGPGTVEAVDEPSEIFAVGLMVRFDRDGALVPIDPDGELRLIEEDPPGFDPSTDGP